MDIQKENNLIQEAFEIEAEEIGFCLDQKWGDYENPYENSETALAFSLFKKGWKAQKVAVPEGFVLVPKEPTDSMIADGNYANMIQDGEYFDSSVIYKAMIEAQEQTDISKFDGYVPMQSRSKEPTHD